MPDDIRARLARYILDRHLPGESEDNLTDQTRLVSSGILDSLAVLELAAFVHRELGVELSAGDTADESFDRLGDIVRLIGSRSSGRTLKQAS
jgi:acyl carrier protein